MTALLVAGLRNELDPSPLSHLRRGTASNRTPAPAAPPLLRSARRGRLAPLARLPLPFTIGYDRILDAERPVHPREIQ
jgi:hypothetical protein